MNVPWPHSTSVVTVVLVAVRVVVEAVVVAAVIVLRRQLFQGEVESTLVSVPHWHQQLPSLEPPTVPRFAIVAVGHSFCTSVMHVARVCPSPIFLSFAVL